MVGRMQQQLKDEGVDVNGVTEVMEEMSRRNRELFKLPPYVLYVSRAFSTLEGIGLSVNPDYSILQECYPYLSQRLMTDNSPRAKQALRSMLLGNGPILSPAKLLEMSDGFSSYTEATTNAAAAAGGQPSSGSLADQESKKTASVALAKLLLSPSGNFIQDILVEGVTKTADALVRDRIHKAEASLPGRLLRTFVKTPHAVANRFIPAALRPLATPLTLPYDVLSSLSALTKQGQEDQSVLDRISGIETLATTPTTSPSTTGAILTYVPIPNTPSSSPSTTSGEPQNPGISFDRITKELRDPQSPVRTLLQDDEIRQMLPSSTTNITRKLLSSLFTRAADRVDLTLKEHISSKNLHNPPQINIPNMTGEGGNGGTGREEVNIEVLKSIGTLTSSSARQIAKLISPPTTTTTQTVEAS